MQRYMLRLGLTMAGVWLLLSGMFKPMLLVLGVLSVLLVVYLSMQMKVMMHRGQPVFIRFAEVAQYWGWLLIEIMKSNYHVTCALLHPDLPIKPTLRRVSATPNTELGRVIYANSITLTPGTTAINFTRQGDILVHALHESSLDELDGDVMAQHVRTMESRRKDAPLPQSDSAGSGSNTGTVSSGSSVSPSANQ